MDAIRTQNILDACKAEVDRYEAGEPPPAGFPELPPIPASRYLDPEMFELEKKHLFSRTWLYAANGHQIPDKGDYVQWDKTGDSIIIVRESDEKISAYYNTCLHRGGALVKREKGNVRNFACRFHGWVYGLDGRLKGIPREQDFPGIDKCKIQMIPLRCEQWGDMVFVNKDLDAQPLKEFLGPLVEDFVDMKLDKRRVFKVIETEMPCNWKIVIDAFVESYHLPATHPESVMMYTDHRGSHIDLYKNGHSAMYTLQLKTDDAAAFAAINAENSGDPEHRISREAIRGYTIFPNIQVSTAECHYAYLVFWPTSINTTDVQMVFTAPEGMDDENSVGAKQLLWAYDGSVAEDLDNLSWLQKSIESGALKEFQINYIERRINHLAEHIDNCIGVENIPEHLRIPHVVSDYEVDPYREGVTENADQVCVNP